MKFLQAASAYLMTSRQEHKTPRTLEIIDRNLDLFVRWYRRHRLAELYADPTLDFDLEPLTALDLRQFLEAELLKGKKAVTVHQTFRVWRAFLRWCKAEGLLAENPMERVKPPKLPQALPKILTEENLRDLDIYLLKFQHSRFGKRDKLIVDTLLGTGLRAQELLNLDVADLNFSANYLLVRTGKQQKDRIVPIPPALWKPLFRYVNTWRNDFHPRCPAVFLTQDGLRMMRMSLTNLLHRALAQVGVKGSAHIFRHTYATMTLRAGQSETVLQMNLGHASREMTARYVHLLPEDQVRAAMTRSAIDLVIEARRRR